MATVMVTVMVVVMVTDAVVMTMMTIMMMMMITSKHYPSVSFTSFHSTANPHPRDRFIFRLRSFLLELSIPTTDRSTSSATY
jgi:hypothetical protein